MRAGLGGWGAALALCCALGLGGCADEGPVTARITTPEGVIRVRLYDETPVHRDNFDSLARAGFYDTLLFHRVIQGFMIQGGDPSSRHAPPAAALGMGDPGYTLPAEIGAPHLRGALAAARTGGPQNPAKRSSGSQFYIVQGRQVPEDELEVLTVRTGVSYNATQRELYATEGGRPDLDGEYTVFGEVIEGMDVVDRIAARITGRGDRPVEDVWMMIEIE